MKQLFAAITAIFLLQAAGAHPAERDENAENGQKTEKARILDISLSAETGLLWGLTEELVYNYGNLYSRLDWQKNFVPVFNVQPRVNIGGLFFVRGDFLAAVPVNSGKMEDYDWLVPTDTSICSNYSQHDLNLDNYIDLAFDAGALLKTGKWRLEGGAGVLLRWVKWTSNNGYAYYNWTGDVGLGWYYEPEHKTYYFTGPVIIYSQSWVSPFVSFDAAFEIKSGLEIECNLRTYIYPLVEAYDEHILSKKEFHDTLNHGGAGGKIRLFTSWKPAKLDITFHAGVDFEYVWLAKAYTLQRVISKTEYQDVNLWSDGGVVSTNAMQGSVFLGAIFRAR